MLEYYDITTVWFLSPSCFLSLAAPLLKPLHLAFPACISHLSANFLAWGTRCTCWMESLAIELANCGTLQMRFMNGLHGGGEGEEEEEKAKSLESWILSAVCLLCHCQSTFNVTRHQTLRCSWYGATGTTVSRVPSSLYRLAWLTVSFCRHPFRLGHAIPFLAACPPAHTLAAWKEVDFGRAYDAIDSLCWVPPSSLFHSTPTPSPSPATAPAFRGSRLSCIRSADISVNALAGTARKLSKSSKFYPIWQRLLTLPFSLLACVCVCELVYAVRVCTAAWQLDKVKSWSCRRHLPSVLHTQPSLKLPAFSSSSSLSPSPFSSTHILHYMCALQLQPNAKNYRSAAGNWHFNPNSHISPTRSHALNQFHFRFLTRLFAGLGWFLYPWSMQHLIVFRIESDDNCRIRWVSQVSLLTQLKLMLGLFFLDFANFVVYIFCIRILLKLAFFFPIILYFLIYDILSYLFGIFLEHPLANILSF